jgi:ribosome biogenesis GTPase A
MKQIQWFPGHMAKARRLIEEKLPITDIVFELLDARIPMSSRNPMMDEIIKNKPRLVILNKSDLADENITKEWIDYYNDIGVPAISVDSIREDVLNKIYPLIHKILNPLRQKEVRKGMKPRPFRGMIIGIPNVGKSQFINNLAGKTKVKTGNVPGVTKIQSFITTKKDLILFDNPGVLWPKFENEDVAMNLATMGSIKDNLLPLDEVMIYAIKHLMKYYPNNIKTRYKIEISDPEDVLAIIDQIGIKRGCKISGGEIDYEKVYKLFLYDLRNLKLGRISLERVNTDVQL